MGKPGSLTLKKNQAVKMSIENVSPHKDPSYIPSKSEESDEDEEEEVSMAVPSKLKPQTPQNDFKFLVFMEQLDELLHRCPTCGAVVSKRETSTREVNYV